MEEFGSKEQLIESLDGGQAKLVYLIEKDALKLESLYNGIKQSKSIVGTYAIGDKHCLVVLLNGNFKITRSK